MIMSLEMETGITQLFRSHYGVRMTPEGERLLQTDPFVAVLPKAHPLAQKKSVSFKELAVEPYLLLEEGSYSEPLEAFRREGITPDIRLTMHDDYSILSMVEQRMGFSFELQCTSTTTYS